MFLNLVKINSYMIIILLLLFISSTYQVIQGPVCEITWKNTNIKGVDIGIGQEGSVYVIGIDNRIYHYDQMSASYEVVKGYRELMNPTTIKVSPKGITYVIANCGTIYYYQDEEHDWIPLENICARELDIGIDNSLWIITCENKIAKVICNSSHCNEVVIDGHGKNIALSPEGEIYITTIEKDIMKLKENMWVTIDNMKANDLAVSNEGVLFVISSDNNILYRVISEELGTWQEINAVAKRVSVGPYSLPGIVSYISGLIKVSF